MGGYNGGFGAVSGGGYGTWGFGPGAFIGLSILGMIFIVWFIIAIALKGYALWIAAKRNEKWWFIALLVINTMGLLELVYLILFAKVSWGRDGRNIDGEKHHHTHNGGHSEPEKMSPENEENTKKEAEEVM